MHSHFWVRTLTFATVTTLGVLAAEQVIRGPHAGDAVVFSRPDGSPLPPIPDDLKRSLTKAFHAHEKAP